MDRRDVGRTVAPSEGVTPASYRAQRSRSARFAATVLGAALLGSVSSCGDSPAPSKWDGARPMSFASLERGEALSLVEVESLVARLVEVAGGVARWRSRHYRRIEDLYLLRTGSQLGNQVLATTWVRPDESVRVQLDYRGGDREVRVMLRREEYVHPQLGSLALATGGTQQHVEWDWELARLPVNLLEAEELRPLRPEGTGSERRIGIAVKLRGLNPPFEVWIDPSGPVIEEVRTKLPVTADLSFKTLADHAQRFSDWRRVDGVLLPFKREIFADGRRIGLAECRGYDFDVEVTDAILLPEPPAPPDPPK